MLEILNSIIAKMITDEYDIKLVYGMRWLHNFKGINNKITFYVSPQNYQLNVNTWEKQHTFKWIVAYQTEQNKIDEAATEALEVTIEEMNFKFMEYLKSYTDSSGFKPFIDFETVDIFGFHDTVLFSQPAQGFECVWKFKEILNFGC